MPRATFSISGTGDVELIAAPGARQFIRILGGEISSVAAQSLVALKSGSSTIIWSTVALNVANSSHGIVVNDQNTIDCNLGQALNCNNAAAGNVRFSLQYIILGPP